MAQFYTLEEAARVLGMSPDELKSKAQAREIRAFLDSGSWRFRTADVDELARRRGMGSDPDLSLSDLDIAPPSLGTGSEEIDLSEFQLGVSSPSDGSSILSTSHEGVSDDEILLDEHTVASSPQTPSSSTIIGLGASGKKPSDSDVRLVPNEIKGASDSDVRLAPGTGFSRGDNEMTLVSDEGSVPGVTDFFTTTQGSSSEGRSSLGSSGELRAADDAENPSDFELTPSSVIDALQPESASDFELNPGSGSDFELSALDDPEDFPRQTTLKPSDSDVTAAEPAASGINLGRPSDSGINLQTAGGLGLHGDDSIELAPLDDDDAILAPPKPKKKPVEEKIDLSATALPIKTGKDLFEDTDFEVDALDSGQREDRTVQIDAASDFELEGDSDSGSQVFALDEDDVDQNAATAMAPAVLDDASQGVGAPSAASSGDMENWDDDDDGFDAATSGAVATAGAGSAASVAAASPSPALTSSAPSAEWGGLWVGVLGAATVLSLILSFVAFDLVRNQYEWRENAPSSGLVKFIANTFGG